MDFSTGVQLSLELSRIIPVQKGIEVLGSHLLRYARDLYKSGCNIIIEEDLNNIFGRGKIAPALEDKFKGAVKVQKFTPLYQGCEIRLDSGPGPTMIQALRDSRGLLATVIQLSFLGWTHNREQLAATLAQMMERRIIAQAPGALVSPKPEDIAATLSACSCQSSAFAWSEYVNIVCRKVRLAIPDYRHSTHHLRLSPALLAVAMDCLYLTQHLPDDRFITVSNAIGFVTLTIWAHFILGLTVHITSEEFEAVIFGDTEHAQMVIMWSHMDLDRPTGISTEAIEAGKHEPHIQLLDRNMTLIFQSVHCPGDWTWLTAEDRQPLSEYGAIHLYRALNNDTIIEDHDPIYKESVNLVTALAIHVVQNYKCPLDTNKLTFVGLGNEDSLRRPKRGIEIWRVYDASKLIFSQLANCFETASINTYLTHLAVRKLDIDMLPQASRALVERAQVKHPKRAPQTEYFKAVQTLAYVIFLLAHVEDVHTFSELPLLWDPYRGLAHGMYNLFFGGEPLALGFDPYSIMHSLLALVATAWRSNSASMVGKTCHPFQSAVNVDLCFLASDFGWSLCLDVVGKKDPAEVRPELIHLKRGIPTHTVSGDQRNLLRDGQFATWKEKSALIHTSVMPGEVFPLPATKASIQGEYWTTTSNSFDLIIKYRVDPIERPHPSMSAHQHAVDRFIGYADMFQDLWSAHHTASCDHDFQSRVPITTATAAVLFWGCYDLVDLQDCAEKTIVLLTRGDSKLRWLALNNTQNRGSGDFNEYIMDGFRQIMLRTYDCCDACALKQTESSSAKWFLIL